MTHAAPPPIDALLHHRGLVTRLARSLVGPDDGEDIAQEAYLAAVQQPPRSAVPQPAWLRRVTRNLSASFHRQRARRAARELRAAAGSTSPATDDLAAKEEIRKRVLETLLALEEPYRTVLLQRFYEGLPPRVIARSTGTPVETVRTRIKRGLTMMRGRLDDLHEGDRRRWHTALLPWLSVPTVGWKAATAATVLVLAGAGAWLVTPDGEAAPPPSRKSAAAGAAGTAPTLAPRGKHTERPQENERRGTRPRIPSRASKEGSTSVPLTAPAGRGIHGTVVDALGTPIPQAIIAVLPRDSIQQRRIRFGFPQAGSAQDGRWRLPFARLGSWMLRVYRPGYLPEFVEASKLSPEQAVRTVLRKGPRVHVRVQTPDGGVPSIGTLIVRATSLEKDLEINEQVLWVPHDTGRIDAHLEMRGPVRLECKPSPMHFPRAAFETSPVFVDLRSGGEAEFTVFPTCRLMLSITDAQRNGPPTSRGVGWLTIRLTDELTGLTRKLHYETQRSAFTNRTDRSVAWDFQTWEPIAPGTYTVEVSLQGWSPWRRESVRFDERGQVIELDVKLDPADDRTETIMTSPQLKEMKAPSSTSILVRLAGRSRDPWAHAGGRHDEGAGTWTIHDLKPGHYDVFAYVHFEPFVGIARNVRVERSGTGRFELNFVRGTRFPLAEPLSEHEPVRDLKVVAEGFGCLPLYLNNQSVIGDGRMNLLYPKAFLGPYPFEALRLEIKSWSDEIRIEDVRGEEADATAAR